MIVGRGDSSPRLTDNFSGPRPAQFSENVFQNVGRRVTGIDEELGNPLVRVIEQQQAAGRIAITAVVMAILNVIIGLRQLGTAVHGLDKHTPKIEAKVNTVDRDRLG